MQIGSYQVLLELGRGGMGTVYLGRALGAAGFERLVAIKRAHPHLLSWRGVAERFLDEARQAALIHHANVVSMHHVGEDKDGPYLVFDYVEGASLAELMERAERRHEPMPVDVVVRVLLDALAGLHAAHEAVDSAGAPLNMLHRDVSTQNLLIGRDGVTRLSDFGIAKSHMSSVVTDDRYVQGKLLYLAPEYLERKPVGRPIDVYGMGVSAWLALAGQEPWPGLDGAQLMHAIMDEPIPPLHSVSPDLPAELAAVVDKACSHDPQQRFQTAQEMHDALEQAGRALDRVASYSRVARYLEQMVGPVLLARRETLRTRRRELGAPGADSAAEASPPKPTPQAEPPAAPAEPEPDPTKPISVAPSAARPKGHLRAGLVLAGLALAVALALLWPGDRTASEERRAPAPTPPEQPAQPAATGPALTPAETQVRTEPLPVPDASVAPALPPSTEAADGPSGPKVQRRPRKTREPVPSDAPGIDVDNPYR